MSRLSTVGRLSTSVRGIRGYEGSGRESKKRKLYSPLPVRTLEVTPTFLIVNDVDDAFDYFLTLIHLSVKSAHEHLL